MLAVKHLLNIKASKERVFEAVNTIEGLKSWLTVKTSGSAHLNQHLRFRFEEIDGPDMLVNRIIPSEKIEWLCISSPHGWKGNTITFQFEAKGALTVLRFSHGGWLEQNDSYAYCNSTWGHYLDSLKSFCESGIGSPFSDKK